MNRSYEALLKHQGCLLPVVQGKGLGLRAQSSQLCEGLTVTKIPSPSLRFPRMNDDKKLETTNIYAGLTTCQLFHTY